MTLTNDLAGRIIAGARAGSLLLTIAEVKQMIDNVHPDTALIIDGAPVRVIDVPVIVVDDLDPYPNLHLDDERNRLEAWRDQLTASVAEDLIDADDVERLWHRPPDR